MTSTEVKAELVKTFSPRVSNWIAVDEPVGDTFHIIVQEQQLDNWPYAKKLLVKMLDNLQISI
jgi:hypothetical protein